MRGVDREFKERVYEVVRHIPKGRVMSYGQIAALCGSPRAARIVGGIAHFAPCAGLPACLPSRQPAGLTAQQSFSGSATPSKYFNTSLSVARRKKPAAPSARHEVFCPEHDLPWQRVVMADGSLAPGYPGGTAGHAAALRAEGVEISDDFKVADMAERLWRPAHPNQNSLL